MNCYKGTVAKAHCIVVLGLPLMIKYKTAGWHRLILINVAEIFKILFFHPKEHFSNTSSENRKK